MKTETFRQAIDYALHIPVVEDRIAKLEAHPNRFAIAQVVATIMDYSTSSIQVVINFHEAGNPNAFKEDIVVDLQGTSFTNFIIKNITDAQI